MTRLLLPLLAVLAGCQPGYLPPLIADCADRGGVVMRAYGSGDQGWRCYDMPPRLIPADTASSIIYSDTSELPIGGSAVTR